MGAIECPLFIVIAHQLREKIAGMSLKPGRAPYCQFGSAWRAPIDQRAEAELGRRRAEIVLPARSVVGLVVLLGDLADHS